MRVIPVTPGLRSSARRVQLAGREYSLALRWSDFEGCFYLTISNAAGDVLVSHLRVVSQLRLIAGVGPLDSMPAGELSVLDGSPRPSDPTLTSLGDAHSLVFVEGVAA